MARFVSLLSKIRTSFALRVAALTAILFAALVTALLGMTYVFMFKQPLEAIRLKVDNDTLALSTLYEGPSDEAALINMLESFEDDDGPNSFFYLLLSQKKKILAGNIPLDPNVFQGEGWDRVEFETGYSENSALLKKVSLAGGVTLIAGRDIEALDEREELLTETLGWGAGIALLLGLFGGGVISFAVTRRIEAINRAAHIVMNGKLGSRIPIRGSGDDFDNLSATLNTMLDRIEELLGMVSSVSDNIAHELRTPLARLMADLEDIEDYSKSSITEPELHQMIDQAYAQADRMRQIFDSLLRISRIQSGRDNNEFQPINLANMTEEAVDLYAPISEQNDISLSFTKPAHPLPKIEGDSNLLFQAVTNILDNALKFTPSGGEICVTLTSDEQFVILGVKDNGPGVPEKEKERLGERFYQATTSQELENSENTLTGNGLGLALVRAIIKQHNGAIHFPESDEGLSVELVFPL